MKKPPAAKPAPAPVVPTPAELQAAVDKELAELAAAGWHMFSLPSLVVTLVGNSELKVEFIMKQDRIWWRVQ